MTRQTLHKWGVVVLLLACLLVLGGCQGNPAGDEDPQPTAQPADMPPIQPNIDTSVAEERKVTLYFRMQGEQMLAGESRTLRLPRDRQVEQVIIEALTGGPSSSLLELSSAFGGTKVSKVFRSGDILTVTMNHEFLSIPEDAPVAWMDDPVWRDKILVQRQMALLSIVNTLTEATDYAAIQFLVQDNADQETGRRLYRSDIFEGDVGSELLEPIKRDESYILTHYNTAMIILQSWQDQDYERTYRFVAREVEQRPTDAAFRQDIIQRDRSLMDFTISPGSVSIDGQRAVLEATFSYRAGDKTVHVQSFPLKLVRENGLWKITYAELIRLMEAL